MSSVNRGVRNTLRNKCREKRKHFFETLIATSGFIVLLFLYLEGNLNQAISEFTKVDNYQLRFVIIIMSMLALIAAIFAGFSTLQYGLTFPESLFSLSENAIVNLQYFSEKQKDKYRKRAEESIKKMTRLIERGFLETPIKFAQPSVDSELERLGKNLGGRLLPGLKDCQKSNAAISISLLRKISLFLSNYPLSFAELEKINILLEALPATTLKEDFWAFLSPIFKRTRLSALLATMVILSVGSVSFLISTQYLQVPSGYAYSSAIVIITTLASLYLKYGRKKV